MGRFIRHLSEEHTLISKTIDALDLCRLELLGHVTSQQHLDSGPNLGSAASRGRLDSDPGLDLESGSTESKARLDSALALLKTLVENVHHRKEEELLFETLMSTGNLPGGPRCLYFMGTYLNSNRAEQLLSSVGRISNVDERFRHSPLSIPLEEHEASHLALTKIAEIASSDDASPGRSEALASWISNYVGLMRLHIEKEETCLFVMADRLLDEATQERLLKRATDIDREEGFSLESLLALTKGLHV